MGEMKILFKTELLGNYAGYKMCVYTKAEYLLMVHGNPGKGISENLTY